MAVIAIVLRIVIAAPEYAEPAAGAGLAPVESSEASPDASATPFTVEEVLPTSDPPDKLKGYRWPVRGGMIAKDYDHDREGRFVIDGERTHTGLVITWFEGATVKAAHKGKVVAAGRDWARHVGFDGSMDRVYARYAKVEESQKKDGKSKKPQFSLGVVVKDGNGYYSVYTELKDLLVKPGDKVKPGQPIGRMSVAEKKYMMRYRLVRMDGPLMRVHESARERGYPPYARERVDPLAVFNLKAKRKPKMKRQPPADPPRLSDY